MTTSDMHKLLNDDQAFELLKSHDIFPHFVVLGGDVSAFVYRSKSGNFHIFINQALSYKACKEVFIHELYHIIFDMPNFSYIFGVDMQRSHIELNADNFVYEVLRKVI